MTYTALQYKYCKHCRKRFDREEGLTNYNWQLKQFCCHEHQVQHGNDMRGEERKRNHKYCSYCKKNHPKSEFNKDNNKPDELHSTCKKAQAVYYKNKKGIKIGNADLNNDMKRLIAWQPLLSRMW